ncbi:MAG: hypothetical protein ABIR93_10265 [Saprospiraceae bacterium]
MQPVIWFTLSVYVMAMAEEAHKVVAVAVPVLAGIGFTLHDMVMVDGQVIVTCPDNGAMEAKASTTDKVHHANLLFKVDPWGLAPG